MEGRRALTIGEHPGRQGQGLDADMIREYGFEDAAQVQSRPNVPAVEQCFAPLTHWLGWRLEFPWSRYTNWAERAYGVRLVERRAMPPFGHFSLIRFAKERERAALAHRQAVRANG